jgi:hypothetical protein
MLPEMFHPRIQRKRFDETPVEGGILEFTPVECAVSPILRLPLEQLNLASLKHSLVYFAAIQREGGMVTASRYRENVCC